MKRTLLLLMVLSFSAGIIAQVNLDAKVFLQGPYAGNGQMHAHLNNLSTFPLAQPYHLPPWNYFGTESLMSVPDSVVDWVLLELRSAPDTIVDRRAALLLRNGRIVNHTDFGPVQFEHNGNGIYYVAVHHRNHFPVMSAQPISFPFASILDFSDTLLTPPYGGGRKALIFLGGSGAMISGDLNHNNQLKYSGSGNDRSFILQKIIQETGSTSITTTLKGYFDEDVNMDSVVKYTGAGNDASKIIQSLIAMTGSTSITTVYNGVVPIGVVRIPVFQCGDTLRDARDGKMYPTVQIGTRCWMARNLNVGVMVNSNAGSTHSDVNDNGIIEKYCFDNDTAYCAIYGGLYDWDEMMDYQSNPGVRGICPTGWLIPTDEEWCALLHSLDSTVNCSTFGSSGIDAGGQLKASGLDYWNAPNAGATNASGFTALGAGYRRYNGLTVDLMANTSFWSSSEYSSTEAISRSLITGAAIVYRTHDQKVSGFSVRCIKDSVQICNPQPDQANAGQDAYNIGGNTFTLTGNTPSHGSGLWTILSGQGGSLADATSPQSLFTGQFFETYTLVWTITTVCGSSSDTLNLGFDCAPYPDPANAGQDAYNIGGNTFTLTGNTPSHGSGLWTILSGQGGSLADATNPQSLFTGQFFETYTLLWTITTVCGSSSDTLSLGFDCAPYPDPANAGQDAYNIGGNTFTLTGNTPSHGSGLWTILSGQGGSLADATNPQSLFTGQFFETYTLVWTITTVCGSSSDTLSLGFDCAPYPDAANAGQDAYNIGGNTFTLTGNTPSHGSGLWTILSGQGGSLADATNPHSLFTGQFFETYTLVWTITTVCGSSSDTLNLGFDCAPYPDQANAGTDQAFAPGSSYVLQGNTPVNGSGQWVIHSGMGGFLSDSSLSNCLLSGQPMETYQLSWTITTLCGSSSDTLSITFGSLPPFQCGDTLIDYRDGKRYPTVQIGQQCWMARNLDIGQPVPSFFDGTIHSAASDNGQIEKYCFGNNNANCAIYGGLYDWDEMMAYDSTEAGQGICPPYYDWYIPTKSDWEELTAFLGGVALAGGPLKDTGTTYWSSPNTGATNSTGFAALPGGFRNMYGSMFHLGGSAFYWTSTASDNTQGPFAWMTTMVSYATTLLATDNYRVSGVSVRCIRATPPCQPEPDQANAGPDSLGIVGHSFALQANTPAAGNGAWTIAVGAGVGFSDTTDPAAVFYGHPGQTYSLVWTISNLCGSNSDTVMIGFAQQDTCPDSLVDTRDGQVYPVLQLDRQCWMGRNLAVGTYTPSITGTIYQVWSNVSDNGVIEKYCFNNDPANCAIYGGLYDWNEMMGYTTAEGTVGICPPDSGWHLPTDAEWKIMEGIVDSEYDVGDPVWDGTGFRGLDVGGKLKETGYTYWNAPNEGATNASGFSARAGGWRYFNGSFGFPKDNAVFWTSTPDANVGAYATIRSLSKNYSGVSRYGAYKVLGNAVRCIKNLPPCEPQPDQANAGPDSFNIPGTTYQLSAQVPVSGVGEWELLAGWQGHILEPANPHSMFHGLPGGSYILRWNISNACGKRSDIVQISFADTITFSCGDSITDVRDGQKYPTVQVASQCWMAKNLNVGIYRESVYDGTSHSELTDNGITEKFCLDNDSSLCDRYGGLYSWDEMMAYSELPGGMGICPPTGGWFVPSDDDWKILEGSLDSAYGVGDSEWEWDYIFRGANAGAKLMDANPMNWNPGFPSFYPNNQSGFGALPGTYRDFDGGTYQDDRWEAYFWTSSLGWGGTAYVRILTADSPGVYRDPDFDRNYGFSVRCLKNLP